MKTKKGFTLIEIIIVIVVLGILTGVLIPVIASVIHKAQKENDKVLVDNMNVIIKADEPYNDTPPETGDEVLWILSGNGFEVDKPNYKDYAFYWLSKFNRVVIYDNEEQKIVYPENYIENINRENMTPENGRFLLFGEGFYDELAYKITYYLNGKEIKFKNKTSYDGTEEIILPIPNINKLGEDYEFTGWFTNKDLSGIRVDKITVGTVGNLTFYAEFYKKVPEEDPVSVYSIDYELNGGKLYNPIYSYNVPLVDDIILPTPVKENHIFMGWYDDPEFTSNEVVRLLAGSTGNKKYYAKWEEIVDDPVDPDNPVDSVTTYTITYVLDGGKLYNAVNEYTTPLTEDIILPTPLKDKCIFDGWYDNAEFTGEAIVTINKTDTGNKVFYAKWIEQEEPDKPIIPEDPVYPVYKIEYDLQGGTNPIDAPTEYDGKTQIILPVPEKEGCVFLYWTNADGAITSEIHVGTTGDQVFTAHWFQRTSGEYYITYVLNGGLLYEPPTVMTGEADIYLYTPLRRGYDFAGWYLNPNDPEEEPISVIPIEMQDHDITLYAKWNVIEYSINYELNGGIWEDSNIVNYSYIMEEITEYSIPIREGYGFQGWYDNPDFEGLPVTSTNIGETGNKNLYAKWKEGVYQIIYVVGEIDNPEDIHPREYSPTQEVILPIPKKFGYSFEGWYDNKDYIGDPITIIPLNSIGTKVFFAKFEIIECELTYDLNGGSFETLTDNPFKFTIEDLPIELKTPTKKYYDYKGLYLTPDFTGETITIIDQNFFDGELKDITVYARFDSIELEISANFDGGTLENRTISKFAEELVNDFNSASNGNVSQVTDLLAFKKTSDKTIAYAWGSGNLEMIEKYQWFFEFAKKEIINAAISNGYNTTYPGIYNSVVKMFDVLLAQPGDPLYYYKPHALDIHQYQTSNQGVYTINGCDDTKGNNKTLFRSWIDGLLNSNFYYAADIYRGCMVDYSKPENMKRFTDAYTGSEISLKTQDKLPIPIKEGYIFLGWYDEADKKYETTIQIQEELETQGILVNEFKLYAKWQQVNKYEITFDLLGGHWEEQTLDNFINELIYYFQIPYNGDNDSSYFKQTTKETFLKNSRPNVNIVWYDAFTLNKYLWLFDFLKAEINTYAAAWDKANNYTYYVPSQKILEYMTERVDGKMKDSAINCFNSKTDTKYNGELIYNESTIDVLCELIHCLMNQRGSLTTAEKTTIGMSNTTHRSWIPDYSNPENMARFNSYYYATDLKRTYYEGDILPTPVREGYTFLGWFDNAGYEVKTVTSNTHVRALWQKTVSNDAELLQAIDDVNNGTVSEIVLKPGTYTGNYTISKPWVLIHGPNFGINPNTKTRGEEAVFKGTLTIDTNATGLVIDGLAFTGNAKITATTISNFAFRNNYIFETSNTGKSWDDTSNYDSGFMTILLPSGSTEDEILSTKLSTNLDISNNRFDTVDDVNIYIANSKDVSIVGNVFKNFEYDAIRFGDAFTDGKVNILNNEFIQDTKNNTSTNGIYFRMYGHVKGSDSSIINIKNNKFVNIGYNSKDSLYKGAISAKNYKEYGATFNISNNYFESCYNYIRLRNNATAENHSTYAWSCIIENNQFIGLPHEYYFASWNGESSDNDLTLPIKTVFGANYYEDNEGNVITTLDESKFLQVKSIGTALTKRPN